MGRGAKRLYLLGSSLVFFVAACIAFAAAPTGYDPTFVMTCSVAAALFVVLQAVNNRFVRGIKSWIQVDLLFLLMFYFVHFWLWAMVATSEADLSGLPSDFADYVNRAVALSLLGLTAFILGVNARSSRFVERPLTMVTSSSWVVIGQVVFYAGAGSHAGVRAVLRCRSFSGQIHRF